MKGSTLSKILLGLLAALTLMTRISACSAGNFSPAAPTAQVLPPAQTAASTGARPVIAQFECVNQAEYQTAQLVQVIDGDTIDVRIDGSPARVRYIGINAPESDEGLGEEAAQLNAALVEGQTLYLVTDVSDTDQYGRLLRYVFTETHFVNHELLLQGYARQGDYEPDTACSDLFKQAEQTAQGSALGVWASPQDEEAARSIEITALHYDGGAGQNEPDEYVEITNTGRQAVNLDGWYLKDQGRHRFEFPSMLMEPGQACRIYTDEHHPETCGLSFALRDSAVWNNSGDCAALYDGAGLLVDEHCYP